jgi:hypothetical protein
LAITPAKYKLGRVRRNPTNPAVFAAENPRIAHVNGLEEKLPDIWII